MIEVNLSRIHSMIQTFNATIQQKKSSLEEKRTRFTLKIMENTSNADQKTFMDKVGQKKKIIDNAFVECLHILDYIEYLKNCIAEGNAKYGISEKLLKASYLTDRIRLLENIYNIKKTGCNEDVDPDQNVDYYKSAFTDYNKVFDLEIFMFNDADLELTRNEINETRTKLENLRDEIASLNQTKIIEIMSIDEFGKNNFETDSSVSKHD